MPPLVSIFFIFLNTTKQIINKQVAAAVAVGTSHFFFQRVLWSVLRAAVGVAVGIYIDIM
jgi:hypothetical protein